SVPEPSLFRAPSSGGQPCQASQPEPIPPRFEPILPEGGMSRAVPYDEAAPPPSAVAATGVAPEDARPSVVLQSRLGESVAAWRPRRDLLGSDPSAREFVVETDSDGTAHLRFGDDRFGLRPAVGTSFTATYRLGNGSRGNVGAGAIAHVVATD